MIKSHLILLAFAIFSSQVYAQVEDGNENEIEKVCEAKQEPEETHQEKPHWVHSEQENWPTDYPLCGGSRQSPINILLDDVVYHQDYSLEFIDYDQELNFNLKNTNHSVSVSPSKPESPPTVKINWIPGENEYQLQEIHFHWGDGVNKGSEHEINGERAAAEMHMVHFRKGVDASEIGKIEDSVVVVGVFIESDHYVHNKLESLVSDASQVNGTDMPSCSENPNNLIHLLPDYHHSFYTYSGSLTTPPCYEVVTWVLLSSPVYMSNDKLVQLANLKAVGDETKIESNNRDIQPLFDRQVYSSFNVSESVSPTLKKDTTDHQLFPQFSDYFHILDPLKRYLRLY